MATLQKPLIQRLDDMRRGDASGGFGAVFPPGMPLSEAPRRSSSMPTLEHALGGVRNAGEDLDVGILARLISLQPERQELRERLQLLIGELAPLLTEAEELVQQIETENRESLEQKHREIRKQGRKQQAVCEQLSQELKNAELTLMNIAGHQENILNELRALKLLEEKGHNVGRWASDAELSAWDERVNKAKARVVEANEAAAIAVRERNEAAERRRPAEEELARLGTEEIRLRAEISGESFVDPEFGLSVPASAGL
jgi:hypothetical protein